MKIFIEKVVESPMGREFLAFGKTFKIRSFFSKSGLVWSLNFISPAFVKYYISVPRADKSGDSKGGTPWSGNMAPVLSARILYPGTSVMPWHHLLISHQIGKCFKTWSWPQALVSCWLSELRVEKDRADCPRPLHPSHFHIYRFCNDRPCGTSMYQKSLPVTVAAWQIIPKLTG